MSLKSKKCIVCQDDYKSRVSSYEGEHKGEMLCNKHLLQVKRNGKIVDSTRSRRRDIRVCDICGDSEHIRQFGIEGKYKGYLLCSKHYHQATEHDEIIDPTFSQKYKKRECEFCGSEDDVLYYAKDRIMLCRRHYNQKHSFGRLLTRTIKDKNEIVIYEDYAEVVLYNLHHEETGRAKINLEYIDLIRNYKWHLNNWGYADTKVGNSTLFMQDLIYGNLKQGDIVDHIDRNPLNNLINNLRLSNKSTNAINAGLRVNNKSGVTGVNFSEHNNLWRAYISYDKKRHELGWFKTFEEAVKARLEAEVKHHKEFASQKHLYEEYGVI